MNYKIEFTVEVPDNQCDDWTYDNLKCDLLNYLPVHLTPLRYEIAIQLVP